LGIDHFVSLLVILSLRRKALFLIPSFFESLYLLISAILTVTKEITELQMLGVDSNGLRCLSQFRRWWRRI